MKENDRASDTAIEAALKRGLRVELLLDKDGTIKVQTVSRKKLNIVPTP